MFELEVGSTKLPTTSLPEEVSALFATNSSGLSAMSLTPWEEHCTECAMPACYLTCDLYERRPDGHCRRFVRGVELIPAPQHPQGYLAKVAFKRWGQLMAYANTRLLAMPEAMRIERQVRRVQEFAAAVPGSSIAVAGRAGIPTRLARRWKQRVKDGAGEALDGRPDAFMLEIHNPNPAPVPLSLVIAPAVRDARPPFQQLLAVAPGPAVYAIPFAEIAARIDTDGPLHVTLNPNILRREDEGLALVFGLVAFVAGPTATRDPSSADRAATGAGATRPVKVKHVKVAVWDLDNTMWKGTLVEDGSERLALRPEAVEAVKELDRRGIVNSILSKNHADDALAVLAHHGLTEYFVFPRIGWGEKGVYMRDLIKDFNVDASTFAFIDDQPFERDQVVRTNPGVRAYDAADVALLTSLPEFDPPRSDESASRRNFYRAEEHRVRDSQHFGGEYLEFLRSCEMHAEITHVSPASFDRVQELVQRTNQLNYSGTHYSREEISALLADPAHEAFVLACRDQYGEYGTVGFVLVDKVQGLLRDAMFSCRIQFKRVEHAMLTFLLERYRSQGRSAFEARFVETKKNAAAESIFRDMKFDLVQSEGANRRYRFPLERAIPDDGVVRVRFLGEASTASTLP